MTSAAAVISVNADEVRTAARGFGGNANAASIAFTNVLTGLSNVGGMAGSDPAARDWGNDFDSILHTCLNAHHDLIAALASCAELTEATATNHLNANGQSVVGPRPTAEQMGISKDNLGPGPFTMPPSSAGGTEPKPWWWSKIQDLVGDIWPNGHQDRLHSAASTLRAAGDALNVVAELMQPHIKTVEAQISPEIDSATVNLIKVRLSAEKCQQAYNKLAQKCDAHAKHIDKSHHEMWVAAAELIAALALDFVSDGAMSAIVVRVAARVRKIYAAFRLLVSGDRAEMKEARDSAETAQRTVKPIKDATADAKSFEAADKPPPRDLDKPTGDPATAHLPPLRQHYIEDVQTRLPALERELRDAGASEEDIARAMQALRREIGEEYKNLTPEELRGQIYGRNIEKYGDPLGPTYDFLKNEKHLTDAQIIEGAKRTGGEDLGLGGR